jgi:NIPSNAP
MVVVRNVFQIKFGKTRDAVELWKEGISLNKRIGVKAKSMRVLTDVVGPFYTLVFEIAFESLADFEDSGKTLMSSAEWKAWYGKLVPLIESGHREVFNIAID